MFIFRKKRVQPIHSHFVFPLDGVFFEKKFEEKKIISFSNFSKKRSQKNEKSENKMLGKFMNFCMKKDNFSQYFDIFSQKMYSDCSDCANPYTFLE